MRKLSVGTAILALTLPAWIAADDALVSGPGVGGKCTAFDADAVTGPNKGKRLCYV